MLSVRPVVYKGKRSSLVSLTRLNSLIKKIVVGIYEKQSSFTTLFDSPDTLENITNIIRTSKLMEKHVSRLLST